MKHPLQHVNRGLARLGRDYARYCRESAHKIACADMKIELTARHKHYIDRKVKSGAYGSADEVVREGLRLLEAEDERTGRLHWLQAEVEKGFSGPFTPWTPKDSQRLRRLVARRRKR